MASSSSSYGKRKLIDQMASSSPFKKQKMASSSSSSFVKKSFKYDVFLSFRGEDTRKTFVDHLHLALVSRGITTYKDDETIEKGERIDAQLIRSIEESRSYIIVFSKNYADSSWCLQELSKIMECLQKTEEHTAYPIFYDVEPTEVRNQSGAVEEAFAKHIQNPASGKWRDALKEASNLAGWELKNTANGHEAKFIQKIVEEISVKLHVINYSIDEDLVGIETQVKNVLSFLEIDSKDDVRMIGIWGMGGAGKTTVARAIYDNISIFYEGISFVENVRECSKGMGLKELQRQILSAVLNDRNIDVPGVFDGKNMMKRMMLGRKVLVVLDDVDDISQLEALAGNPNWFKPGSRIIITTRDKQVLVAHKVHVDNIYKIGLLSDDEALCLFSRRAFGREVPIQGYEELSGKVVHYAAGLPLTIKVLGSFLYGITDRPKWVDTLERLKTIPLEETLKKLEISYDGLAKDYQEIFLDVACILKGVQKNKAIRILESCGFHAQIGLEVLEQKSLINISNNGYLGMHDHIEEMGRNIVRRLHPGEPNRHSRLWVKEEIEEILVNDLGTEDTKSMILKYTDIHLPTLMKSLRKMKKITFLSVTYFAFSVHWNIYEGGVQYLPDTLRSICWASYPFFCLPKTFQANDLVNLEMPWSCISQLWEGGERKVLKKLKFVDLSHSKLRTFDLGMTQNLETLVLCSCKDLVELQIPVPLPMLKFLDLSGSKVSNLNLGMTPNIKELRLERCEDLVELQIPVPLPMLKVLNLSDSKVSNLNLGLTPNIKELCLERCEDLVELQMSVALPMLNRLYLSDSKVSNLNLGLTPNLKVLELENCYYLQEIHAPVGCLKNLADLYIIDCLNFECVWVNPPDFSPRVDSSVMLELNAKSLDICPVHPNSNLPKFKFDCEYGEVLPSSSGNLEKLLSFGLCACTNPESFSATICGLKHLTELSIQGNIPELPKHLWKLESLEQLTLCMPEINHLPDNICTLKHLKSLDLGICELLEQLPMDLGRLECLEELNLSFCISLRDIPDSICQIKCLEKLHLSCCRQVEKLPDELGRLECLELLDISGTGISRLPESIIQLKHLEYLVLRSCELLEELPMDLGGLECLEELNLSQCRSLRDIPDSICQLKRLRVLDLSYCCLVEKLPDELGCVECLKELKIEGAVVSRLPESIFELKDLRIIGSTWQLKSYGFTSVIETSTNIAYCFIRDYFDLNM